MFKGIRKKEKKLMTGRHANKTIIYVDIAGRPNICRYSLYNNVCPLDLHVFLELYVSISVIFICMHHFLCIVSFKCISAMFVTHGIPSFYELLVNVSTIFQNVLVAAVTLSLRHA